jgi:hypothetical protein
VFFHERYEVFDGLEAGAFRAGAPASQVLGGVAGVLVVEGSSLFSVGYSVWMACMGLLSVMTCRRVWGW